MISPAKQRRESEIQRQILRLLQARGFVAFKVGAGAFRQGDRYIKMGTVGVSDIIGIMPLRADVPIGRFLAIECKRPGGRMTPEQAKFQERVRESGGIAFVATSVDDVIRELRL